MEGRNGHLALKHHTLHQFTTRKLQALTVLHNYVMRRADGTTAAERFYGAAHGTASLGCSTDWPSLPGRVPAAVTRDLPLACASGYCRHCQRFTQHSDQGWDCHRP